MGIDAAIPAPGQCSQYVCMCFCMQETVASAVPPTSGSEVAVQNDGTGKSSVWDVYMNMRNCTPGLPQPDH